MTGRGKEVGLSEDDGGKMFSLSLSLSLVCENVMMKPILYAK